MVSFVDYYPSNQHRIAILVFRRRAKKQQRKKRKQKSIYELYEPSELERAGLTEEDNRIRNKDVPERMQLRSVPVTDADEEEIKEEALWIYDLIFAKRKPEHLNLEAAHEKIARSTEPASATKAGKGKIITQVAFLVPCQGFKERYFCRERLG